AVRTILAHQADAAARIAEGDQLLAVNLYLERRAIRRRQLLGQEHRCPEPPAELAHRRSSVGPAQKLILFGRQHRLTSLNFSGNAGMLATSTRTNRRLQSTFRPCRLSIAISVGRPALNLMRD